jgi:hypothetical protein
LLSIARQPRVSQALAAVNCWGLSRSRPELGQERNEVPHKDATRVRPISQPQREDSQWPEGYQFPAAATNLSAMNLPMAWERQPGVFI